MHKYFHAAVAVALLTAVAGSAHAQSQSQSQRVDGRWTVSYRRQVPGGDGSEMQDVRATVTMVQRGDSVYAKWQIVEPATPATPPRVLRGVMHDGVIQLVGPTTQATVKRHIFTSQVDVTPRYQITIDRDRLEGTMIAMSEDGSVKSAPMTFAGTRDKP